MNYSLEPSTDYPSLLKLYRSLTGCNDRAEDHYRTRARQRGENAFFQTCFITRDGQRIGLAEFGKYTLADSPLAASLAIFLSSQDWRSQEFRALVSTIEQILKGHGFSRVTASTDNNREQGEFVSNGYSMQLEFVESEFDLRPLKAQRINELPEGFAIRSFAELSHQHGDTAYQGGVLFLVEIAA